MAGATPTQCVHEQCLSGFSTMVSCPGCGTANGAVVSIQLDQVTNGKCVSLLSFKIASKYCISDSFVDRDGYSISSKAFLPTVVDIMVIWVKLTQLNSELNSPIWRLGQTKQEVRPRGATPRPRSGAATECAMLQWHRSGREALPHFRGQGRWQRRVTPCSRTISCLGAGGPRGATPCSRSGGVAMRRYPSSKVRNSSCALLEQLWRDTPCPK